MSFFLTKHLIYLAFHAIGFFLSIASILGIPGDLDKSSPWIDRVTAILNFLLVGAWYGIPVLFVATLISFYFKFTSVGQLLSLISLVIGVLLFVSVIILHALS